MTLLSALTDFGYEIDFELILQKYNIFTKIDLFRKIALYALLCLNKNELFTLIVFVYFNEASYQQSQPQIKTWI